MTRLLSVLFAACLALADPARAGTLIRSVLNDTGAAVNDFHMYEIDGKKTILKVSSPSMPTGGGNGTDAQSSADLSGGSVARDGTMSVSLSYPGWYGGTGRLDWYWTLNGVQVGTVHHDFQAWYTSAHSNNGNGTMNFVLIVENHESTPALFSNFTAGSSATGFDPDQTTSPGGLPPASTVLVTPMSFTIQPGDKKEVPIQNFHIDSFFDVFTELSLDGSQSWIASSARLPEPSTWLGGVAALGLIVLRRRCRR